MQVISIKKNKNKYKIILNNEVIDTYEEVILKYNLLYKKELENSLTNQIKKENTYFEAYYKALNYLNKRKRSEGEVRKYLKDVSDIDKIIQKLKSINLINDFNFAKSFVNDKQILSLDGPLKIKNALKQLEVSDNIIEEVFAQIDQTRFKENLNKLINKKIKTTKYTGNVLKNKLIIYLTNMGYAKEMITEEMGKINFNHNLDNEKEKIYSKLKLKYQGKELQYKLSQKLYSKGFSHEEIMNFINSKLT